MQKEIVGKARGKPNQEKNALDYKKRATGEVKRKKRNI